MTEQEIIYLVITVFACTMFLTLLIGGLMVFRQFAKAYQQKRYYEEIAREYCINPFWYRSKK